MSMSKDRKVTQAKENQEILYDFAKYLNTKNLIIINDNEYGEYDPEIYNEEELVTNFLKERQLFV